MQSLEENILQRMEGTELELTKIKLSGETSWAKRSLKCEKDYEMRRSISWEVQKINSHFFVSDRVLVSNLNRRCLLYQHSFPRDQAPRARASEIEGCVPSAPARVVLSGNVLNCPLVG